MSHSQSYHFKGGYYEEYVYFLTRIAMQLAEHVPVTAIVIQ